MKEIINFIKDNLRLIIFIIIFVITLLVVMNIKGVSLNDATPASHLVQQVSYDVLEAVEIL